MRAIVEYAVALGALLFAMCCVGHVVEVVAPGVGSALASFCLGCVAGAAFELNWRDGR